MPLLLAGPAPVCPFCGLQEPFEPAIGERIAAVRARLASHDAREQIKRGMQARAFSAGNVFAIWVLALGALYVVFAGGLLLLGKPNALGPIEFLRWQWPPRDGGSDSHIVWWVLFLWTVGFSGIVLLWSLLSFWVRTARLRFARPCAPREPGGPPGCRVCGAELPTEGTLRRCRYCSSDHVVAGGRFLKRQRSIEAALDQFESQVDGTLEKSFNALLRVGTAVFIVSAIGGFLTPLLAAFMPTTRPDLWWLPPALAAAAAPIFLLQRWLLPAPKVRVWFDAQPGDAVLLRGVQSQVVASFHTSLSVGDGKRQALLLLSDGPGKPWSSAIIPIWDDERSETVPERWLPSSHPGGTDIAEQELGDVFYLASAKANVEPMKQGVWLRTVARGASEPHALCLWFARADEYLAPERVLERGELQPQDIMVVQGEPGS